MIKLPWWSSTNQQGAIVGLISRMINCIDSISKEWKAPIKGMMQTQILGHEKVKIDELVKKALITHCKI